MTAVAPSREDQNDVATPADGYTVEQRLATLRAHKEALGRLSPMLEARLGALEYAAETERSERAAQPFRRRFPALHRWATQVIASRYRRTDLEVAAAYELVAAECEEVGQWALADAARQLADLALHHERVS